MSSHSLDGLLVHSLPEICYLTGFQLKANVHS
jgi:Xaa-Pro aminopeptidase